jgi:hypothetical protein
MLGWEDKEVWKREREEMQRKVRIDWEDKVVWQREREEMQRQVNSWQPTRGAQASSSPEQSRAEKTTLIGDKTSSMEPPSKLVAEAFICALETMSTDEWYRAWSAERTIMLWMTSKRVKEVVDRVRPRGQQVAASPHWSVAVYLTVERKDTKNSHWVSQECLDRGKTQRWFTSISAGIGSEHMEHGGLQECWCIAQHWLTSISAAIWSWLFAHREVVSSIGVQGCLEECWHSVQHLLNLISETMGQKLKKDRGWEEPDVGHSLAYFWQAVPRDVRDLRPIKRKIRRLRSHGQLIAETHPGRGKKKRESEEKENEKK